MTLFIIEPQDKADSIVLGCTHYPLIKDNIKQVLPNCKSVDVAKEVLHQLELHNIKNDSLNQGKVLIINTKS